MRSIWAGAISFGLVVIPVKLYAATEQRDIAFRQVHRKDGARIQFRCFCTLDGEEVPYSDIAKGYELPTGDMVVLTDEDLADLPLVTAHRIEVLHFAPSAQVEPIYAAKSYYRLSRASEAALQSGVQRKRCWGRLVRPAGRANRPRRIDPGRGQPVRLTGLVHLVLPGTAGRVQRKHPAQGRAPSAGQRNPARRAERSVDRRQQGRSVILSDLAAVEVAQHNPEAACAYAVQALDQLARQWYATGMDRVLEVRKALQPDAGLYCVQALDDRLYDWQATLSTLQR
jgi:hypothetical protein